MCSTLWTPQPSPKKTTRKAIDPMSAKDPIKLPPHLAEANQPEPTNANEPDQHCTGCPQKHLCRKVWAMPNRGPLSPAGLSLGSVLVFLLPLLTAIITGAVVHHLIAGTESFSPWEIVAAAAGLVLGAFIAWLIMPLIRKRFYESKPLADNCRL